MRRNSNTIRLIKRFTAVLIVVTLVFSLCSCKTNDNSGFDGKRFSQTRHITVNVDSLGSSNVNVNTSECAKYIHDAVLRECNIDVQFIESNIIEPRYGMNSDITVTSDYNLTTAYYRMNSVMNIAPYLNEYKESLTDLISLLGPEYLYYCTDDPSEVWYIAPRDFEPEARITFIRADWLKKLNMEIPTTRDEFHNCLIAFRDNAELLLGNNSASMIPFFIDNNPSVSAKPLFDSMYDPETSPKDIYVNGYNRATQNGYKDALKILNDWYIEGLLPSDFTTIRPMTKESYEPIEYGFVGAFCSKYDYLYANGENAHINTFMANCGDDAEYIAINTFENSNCEYTYWQEDYLNEDGKIIYLPSICEDPLACLVYLNWISNPANIENVQKVSLNNTNTEDIYTYDKYLITCNGLYPNGNLAQDDNAEKARTVAMDVEFIHYGNKCVRYGTNLFAYTQSDIDYDSIYPVSTRKLVCNVIIASEEDFESVYSNQYEEYLKSGANIIFKSRDAQWDQVVDAGDITVW